MVASRAKSASTSRLAAMRLLMTALSAKMSCALSVPAVMVPSPYVTNNHQEKNARALEAAGGAVVLPERECSGQALFQAACGILHDGARRAEMERAMASLGIRDAGERIWQAVLGIEKEP